MTAQSKEYYFKEGCYIEEWHNTVEDQAMSIAKVRVLPKTITKLHILKNTTERYVILSGQGMVSVAQRRWQVGTGDVVIIKPGQKQNIENIGADDLIFLAICTPRFIEENYDEVV